MCCCLKKFFAFLFVIVVLAELYLLWWIRTEAPVGLIGWVETEDASPYYGSNAPDPPYNLSAEDRRLLVDLVAQSHVLSSVNGDFEIIAALRNLARESCPMLGRSPPTNDPSEILEHFSQGGGGECGAIGSVYCALLIAHGYSARVVELIRDPSDVPRWSEGPPDTHVEVEVYSPEHQEWFVSDPTFNCWFHLPDSNVPLSARELQLIAHRSGIDRSPTDWIPLEAAGAVVPEYDGYDTHPRTDEYYIDPILMFNNIFLLYFDIYGERPGDPVQKYTQLLTARFTGSEKVVWLLPPGQKHSRIFYYHQAVNWLPVIAVLLLVLLLMPAARRRELDENLDDGSANGEE